jgi:hypothetical protein
MMLAQTFDGGLVVYFDECGHGCLGAVAFPVASDEGFAGGHVRIRAIKKSVIE